MHEEHASWLDQLDVILAIITALAYVSIPLSAIRVVLGYLPRITVVAGAAFFITCALTHIAGGFGFHDSDWMVLSNAVQAVSSVTFIATLHRVIVAVIAARRQEAVGEVPEVR